MTRLGWPRHSYVRIPSTMDVLTDLALQGAPEGTVVLAGEQTAGRGRAGRGWVTPPGTALLMSVLLRPLVAPSGLSVLPLIAGLAVAEGLESVAGDALPSRIDLKWPNDLLIQDRKLCGVLVQSRSGADGVEFVNLGVGVNVNMSALHLPDNATSLFELTGREWALEEIEPTVLGRLEGRYDDWRRDGGESGIAAWNERALYRNEVVQIENAGSIVSGRFIGVSGSGALRLETNQGIETFVAGDLVRGPRRS